jgi:hypothetical protein
MNFRILIYTTLALLTFVAPILADERQDFDAQLGKVLAKLDREADAEEGAARLAQLIRSEYGTRLDDLKWAVDQSIGWGTITAFGYIQATTGRTFEQIAEEGAARDFWRYTETAGMSSTKMALSLGSFLKRVEKERNSRIFERLRASRRVHAMPDLGSGFGLFQEALDFRRLDSPRPTKIHTETVLTKGEK